MNSSKALRILITAGPTREKLDPVRYLSNHSSGKQGVALAEAFQAQGAEVILVVGPVSIPLPEGMEIHQVETAEEMLAACLAALPVDVALCAAAVCDYRPETMAPHKLSKTENGEALHLKLVPNPDILHRISTHTHLRPPYVIGFAAETQDLIPRAQAKLARKGCDMIVANLITEEAPVFGSDSNAVTIITPHDVEIWPEMGKRKLAERLVGLILGTK
jgi:phosphopantothenoylcysteine decarboxylase/phosphopantothenate--cysteine ligase